MCLKNVTSIYPLEIGCIVRSSGCIVGQPMTFSSLVFLSLPFCVQDLKLLISSNKHGLIVKAACPNWQFSLFFMYYSIVCSFMSFARLQFLDNSCSQVPSLHLQLTLSGCQAYNNQCKEGHKYFWTFYELLFITSLKIHFSIAD